MSSPTSRVLPWTGVIAAAVFACTVIAFGLALPGYSQAWHPVAALGAKGMPHALAFNLVGFVLPGGLAAIVALDLRRRMPADAGWPARVGAQLLLMSALGFVGLGALPLDPDDLHNDASSLHATAWLLWWVAFAPGAALFALGLRGRHRWRLSVIASAVAASIVVFAALLGVALMPAGIAQRLGYAAWLLWLCVVAWRR